MTPTIRKYHRRLWPVLGMLLLLAFIMALIAADETPEQRTMTVSTFSITLEKGAIMIDLENPLPNPSLLVYASSKEESNIEGDQLLGLLGGTGITRFPIDSTILAMPKIYCKIYDPIHKEVVLKATVE